VLTLFGSETEEIAGEWEILQGKMHPALLRFLFELYGAVSSTLDRHTVWTEEFVSVFNLPWTILR
jgi:hypothetical protein